MTRIGFACAYTPLPLIDAVGAAPYRIHPSFTEAPDQAGLLLHDNLCPHVKRILDRAVAPDLPPLAGMVLMHSCDAMRRLADAWRRARPEDRAVLVDLPPTTGTLSARFLASELRRAWDLLADWTGQKPDDGALRRSLELYDEVVAQVDRLRERSRQGRLAGGSSALQRVYNDVSARSLEESVSALEALLDAPETDGHGEGVPVYLFGNVQPDPAAFELFERCGARIVGDDLCTGSRLLAPVGPLEPGEEALEALARALLARPACARTVTTSRPGALGADVVDRARRAGARAVIAQVVKFCDPYLGRMPAVREACADAGLPLLVLEGDCTLRSMGQQSTRIEAFVEMVG